MTSLGLGVLTWRAPETLRQTLITHDAAGFADLFDERVVLVQEGDAPSIEVAQAHGYRVEITTDNLGILGGFEALGRAMTADIILLNENDYQAVITPQDAARDLAIAARLIVDRTAKIVMMRSRSQPGPVLGRTKAQRFYPPVDTDFQTKLSGFVRRSIRPLKARRMAARFIRWNAQAHLRFPRLIQQVQPDWQITSSKHLAWSNNPFLIDRKFYLNTIIAQANSVQSSRRINGFKNFEIEMNSKWWRDQDFPIAQGPGFFTHDRIGSRGY